MKEDGKNFDARCGARRGLSRVVRVGTVRRRVWPPCRLATLTARALTCHFNLTLLLYPGLLAPIPPGEDIEEDVLSAWEVGGGGRGDAREEDRSGCEEGRGGRAV
ncbi:hypothetical protein Pmani_038008 [Petrolisthes manimaculis]|uniref:Uncharacterized protein n=1 Tax=Petrolisthes manimaculis TaxID=1843537 RepID=A0AAE1NG47_9EUCA|nr:hypothetical protein Pmani_038008 [Petrolisthes manimaculis]